MKATIRAAHASDVETLVVLMREFHQESAHSLDVPAARAALTELVGSSSLGLVWLILADGETAGYVAVTFGFSLESFGREAFIADLFVRPAHRACGAGTSALCAVELELRAQNVRALHVEVGRTNEAAQALYRRQGLRDNGRTLLSKPLTGECSA